MKYTSNGIHSPALAKIGDKLYIMPDWKEVPHGTTLSQISWNRPKVVKVKVEQKKVTGSRGATYTLTKQPNGKWMCSCAGYSFRRFCKHSEQENKK